MRKKSLLTFVVLLSLFSYSENSVAQGLEGADSYNNLENSYSSMFWSFDHRYMGVEGSTTVLSNS